MARMNAEKLKRALRSPVRRLDELTARVEELEAEIRECRQHQHRVAELTDVVQELLLPISQRDQDRVDELLARYSRQLG
jgi:prefoldin subunit 5